MLPQLLDALVTAGMPARARGEIGQAFDDMTIAEEEIARAQERHPEHAAAIWSTFRALQRPVVLRDKGFGLYRAHCAELLDRVATGAALGLGTKAEVLGSLSDVSLKAPLNNVATLLYCRLFRDVMGCDIADETIEGFMMGHGEWLSEEAERLHARMAKDLERTVIRERL